MLVVVTSGKGKRPHDDNVSKVDLAGAIADATTVLPLQDCRRYADSGVTDRFFHNIDLFYPGLLENWYGRTVALSYM